MLRSLIINCKFYTTKALYIRYATDLSIQTPDKLRQMERRFLGVFRCRIWMIRRDDADLKPKTRKRNVRYARQPWRWIFGPVGDYTFRYRKLQSARKAGNTRHPRFSSGKLRHRFRNNWMQSVRTAADS